MPRRKKYDFEVALSFAGEDRKVADKLAGGLRAVGALPAVDPEDVRKAGAGKKIKIIGLAHGETSSGVVTQLDPFRKVADELGALLVDMSACRTVHVIRSTSPPRSRARRTSP